MTVDLETAGELLDFGARLDDRHRADEQLRGAVAIHNILERHRVAYLADEVGMGKTLVALGAIALFRHFRPDFKVLVLAPRANIQEKWQKEMRNFVKHNVRFADLRVKGVDGEPVRAMIECKNLVDLAGAVTRDPCRDFFLRMTSFSLALKGKDRVDRATADELRNRLRSHLPWLHESLFDLRSKHEVKDQFAQALCCALPKFDLVIVDEAHNLKHGFGERVSARNRVLAQVFGHPGPRVDSRLFPGYGPRAARVLFLSATPVEASYDQLYNQLDVFGMADAFAELADRDLDEDQKKAVARKFLIRRVTSMRIGDRLHTKNLYRREWRRGGVDEHDEPIAIRDPKHRLVVALMQKKVSELLGHERFNNSFQIGMLASFESFLETASAKPTGADDEDPERDASTFDDAEQAETGEEREGIDVQSINRIARSYRKRFGAELPHPKMDALVDSLSRTWHTGDKALVFVRRVASVKELKRKLDDQYDAWLKERIRRELPESLVDRMERLFSQYRRERAELDGRRDEAVRTGRGRTKDETDRGGHDTFFAWFFRGEGPRGVVSGANVQQRFTDSGTTYATFFERNYVAEVLDCQPDEVTGRLTTVLGVDRAAMREGVRRRSAPYLPRIKKYARADRFEAVQAAALEWLHEVPSPVRDQAELVWHERFGGPPPPSGQSEGRAPDIGDWLEVRTFFTELVRRPALCAALWPEPTRSDGQPLDPRAHFRESEIRAQLLAAVARLGHAFIDLYLMTIRRLGSLELRAQEAAAEGEEPADLELERIEEYLELLDRQRTTPRAERGWAAYDELADIAGCYRLLIDTNLPEADTAKLDETTRLCGQLLRQQQPIGGMSGQLSKTLVRQFRMPGYPLVLISTDLLQEGEDLHTFCSSVHHYGISWTPSSMEQRIGRIDRVRSQTDRRLAGRAREPAGDELLQVYFPHLEDTVEVLQVNRVLERMNTFLRLMHEGLATPDAGDKRVNASVELARGRRVVPQIRDLLETAFPVQDEHLASPRVGLACGPEEAEAIVARFDALASGELPGVVVEWERARARNERLGRAWLGERQQPFTLRLTSVGDRPAVRCTSRIGEIDLEERQDELLALVAKRAVRIGLRRARATDRWTLTVEGDVLLATDTAHDHARAGWLIARVVKDADELEEVLFPGEDSVYHLFEGEAEVFVPPEGGTHAS